MSDRKLRLVTQNSTQVRQPKDSVFRKVNRGQASGQVNGASGPGSPASAEENLRLLKAFSVIDDNRRRAWLLELVEHFAGLDSATH
jgi:hypothetical protein